MAGFEDKSKEGVDFEFVTSKNSNAKTRRFFTKKEKAERAAAAKAPARSPSAATRSPAPASRRASPPPARPARPAAPAPARRTSQDVLTRRSPPARPAAPARQGRRVPPRGSGGGGGSAGGRGPTQR